MDEITNQGLIEKAAAVINIRNIKDYVVGNVGCALVSEKGKIYTGVCLDTGSGMGFCAEASAIAAMITAGEMKIQKIVAVWQDGGDVYVLPPCGRCREFIVFFDKENLNTEVILGKDKLVKLSELLPHYNEYNKLS